ncbi:hypothetical protein FXO37_32612 [Capsicum annuum]|nr:hypothetical protein FXO37_32612 [Capsicum annuum]
MDRYYPGMNKVMRFVFYDDFVNKKIAFRDKDLYEIGLVYFISRFLQSELPRTFIKKTDIDLYVFRDIVFTDEEEVKFNLGAIHQDSLGHEHRNDSDHSVPPITEDAFIVLKTEIANVYRDMLLFQEKVDSQFNGMRDFVEEFVKSAAKTALQNKIIPEFVLADIKIGDKDWFHTLIHTERPWNNECSQVLIQKDVTITEGNLKFLEDGCTIKEWRKKMHQVEIDPLTVVCLYVPLLSTLVLAYLISSILFVASNHQLSYGALLWDYARRKQNDGATSESEATGNVTSKYGGFKRSREQF